MNPFCFFMLLFPVPENGWQTVNNSLTAILWRRLDQPGHEACWLSRESPSWQLVGAAVFAEAGEPCCLSYHILCTADWRTVSATVEGRVGQQSLDVEIESDGGGHWQMNGVAAPQVAGCLDIDLSFSPATNLLPIRRLGLQVGQHAAVRAAWLRFPDLDLVPLEQTYQRLGESTYRYSSSDGQFVAQLTVNAHGLVTHYEGLWQIETAETGKEP